jgi:hypothetical protein
MTVEFLVELQDVKLLEVISHSASKYGTTAKGREYLKKYRELQSIADFACTKSS